ncbi:MAG: succinate dehydrogenase cytochrome b subunit [Clostridiales bacterium]|nr:succinate dehydrogenase cytochrome b subunit [Clostridiales bacterium]
MSITGACLVLFVTFHCLMNSVALLWPAAYNQICAFLGANWYALVASAGLALLMVIHIIYAVWLTMQNRKARGNDRYAVTSKPKQVEWASQNMLVLGIVIVAFLILHLVQFWSKMQLAELLGQHEPDPANGILFIDMAFKCWITPVAYIIGFIALWFHMTHGFWSMFQSAGWDNDIWMPRLKKIGNWWVSIVIALFVAQAVIFTVRANSACDCAPSQEWNQLIIEQTTVVTPSCCGTVQCVNENSNN